MAHPTALPAAYAPPRRSVRPRPSGAVAAAALGTASPDAPLPGDPFAHAVRLHVPDADERRRHAAALRAVVRGADALAGARAFRGRAAPAEAFELARGLVSAGLPERAEPWLPGLATRCLPRWSWPGRRADAVAAGRLAWLADRVYGETGRAPDPAVWRAVARGADEAVARALSGAGTAPRRRNGGAWLDTAAPLAPHPPPDIAWSIAGLESAARLADRRDDGPRTHRWRVAAAALRLAFGLEAGRGPAPRAGGIAVRDAACDGNPGGAGSRGASEARAAAQRLRRVSKRFVREDGGALEIGAGLPARWLACGERLAIEGAPTAFGRVSVALVPLDALCARLDGLPAGRVAPAWRVVCRARWRGPAPALEVRLPGREPRTPHDIGPTDPRTGESVVAASA